MVSFPHTRCGGRRGRPVSRGSRHSPSFRSTIELASMPISVIASGMPQRVGSPANHGEREPAQTRCLTGRTPPAPTVPQTRAPSAGTRRHATAALRPEPRDLFRHGWFTSPRDSSPCGSSPCDTSPCGSLCFCFLVRAFSGRSVPSLTCLCPLSGTPPPPVADSSARSVAKSPSPKPIVRSLRVVFGGCARSLCAAVDAVVASFGGGRHRAALAAPLYAAPLVCSARLPCCRIRCGVVALGRRSSAAAARAHSEMCVVVGGVVAFFGAAAVALLSRRRSTRRHSCALRARRAAASDAAWWRSAAAPLRRRLALSARCASWSVAALALCVRPSTRSSRPSWRPPSRCSRGAALRGAARVLYAPAVPLHPMRRGGARPPLLCGGGSRSQRGARRGRWLRALSACGRRRGRRVLRGDRRRVALAAPLHAAPLACSTRPLCRRIRCGEVALGRRSSAAWSVAARALCVRSSKRSSRSSGRPPSRCSRGAAPRGATRVLSAPAVPPHPMRRGGARPPLLCGGGSRSQHGARRGRWLCALSACGLRRGRRVLRGGHRCAALAAPLHAAPLVGSTRPPCRRTRCGVVALGRRSSAAAARAHSAVRVVVGGCARSLRAAVDEVVASFGAAAVALLSRRRSTRRRSCALRACRAAASDAAWWRSAAAPLRRRLALSARCASWSVAARALCVRPSTRSSRPSWRPPSRCSRGAAPRGAARVLYAPAVPPHPMRRGGARPPLLCGGGSRSQRGARRGRWLRALSACGRRRGRRVLRGGRRRAALAAPLHAAPLVCAPRPPCRRIRCGVVALGRRSSAAAARALSAVRVVVGGCARSLRAAVDEVVAFFGAAAVALLSRRRSTRRRSCALRACRAAASDAAWWRSAAAPLRRRLALSARCASWSVAARALCVRPSTRSSRPSGRPPSRCSRGAAPRGAARVLSAPAVPPHPMRRGGARPPLLCGGGSRSQRGARRGRWLRALSACGRRRGRRVLRGGRRRAALAAPLHAAPLVCSTRPPCRRIRCGVVALGRRSSAAAARALSAVRVVVGGCARSLRAAVDEVVAFFGAATVALLSRRRSTRRRSCALRARRAAASDAAWRRSAAAPLRRRLALSARCASWSVAARALCVRPSTMLLRPSWRSLSRCSRGAAPRGAARVLQAPAVLPHPMRRGGARPPLLCGGGSRSQCGARRGRWLLGLSACGRRRGRRVLRGGHRRAALAAPLHAAPLVCATRPPCRRIRCGVVALVRRSSAAAACAHSVLRVVVGGCARFLRAAVDEVVAFFGAAVVALLSRRRSTRRHPCALRACRAAASDAAWWRSAAAPLRRRLALSVRCASWSVAARALCVRPSTRSSRPSGRPPSRCSRGAAPRGAACVLYAFAVPPHPMRRGGARPPLLCGGGSRSQRGARRGRWLRALSACGRRRGRRVLRGGRRRAALAAPLHAAPLVCATRPPCRRIRCGVVALGRRSSAAAACAHSVLRVVVGGCARSLRAAVDEVVAFFGAAAVALLSRRRSTRRHPCALRARRAAAIRCGVVALGRRSSAAAARALSAVRVVVGGCARSLHAAVDEVVASFVAAAVALLSRRRSMRRRSCARCARRAAASDVAGWRSAAAPLRRRLALSARCASWSVAARALCVRSSTRLSRPSWRSLSRCSCGADPRGAARVLTRLPCRRIRRGVVALGRRSSAAAAPALSVVRVLVGEGARSLRASVGEVVTSFGAAAVALLSRRRSTRRHSCALRARCAAVSDAAWWRSAAAPLRRRLALSAWCASWSVAARALCVRPSTRASRSSGRPPSRCSCGDAPRGAARVLYAFAVPPHPTRRGGARPPLLCGGGSRSQRGARRGRWLRALSACGRRRGRRVLRGGYRRAALAAPLHAAPLVCATRPPCRRIRCGVAALGRRSSAAAACAHSVLRVVVGGCARSLRAAVDEVVAFFGAATVALLSRRRSTRRHRCALCARRAAVSDAAWWRSASAPLRRRLALSARCASWSVAVRALCMQLSMRSSRPSWRSPSRCSRGAAPRGAARVLTRLPCRRIRRGVAALGRRSSAAAAPALSVVRVLVGEGARSLRASVGEVVASFGAAAIALLSRRRSTRRRSCALRACRAAASDAAWWRSAAAPLLRRLALSAQRASWSVAARALCVRPSTRCRVLRGGRHRAALAAPLHASPLMCSTRLPCRRVRCGVAALGRRSSAAAARALSAVRVVVGGGARSLRAAVDEVVASFVAVAVALLSRRRSTRRCSCAPGACRAAASDAAWWRSAAAPLRRRLATCAPGASESPGHGAVSTSALGTNESPTMGPLRVSYVNA